MTIAFIVITLIVVVSVHEAAHALAMRRFGVPIEAAGLGMPLPPVLRVPTRWGWTFTVSPWLVMAYVSAREEDQERLDELPYREQAWYLNAGIIANLILGFGGLSVATAMTGRWITAVIMVVAAVGCWLNRYFLAAYLLPVAALPALASVVASLIFSWSNGKTGMGLAGLGEIGPQTWAEVPFFLGGISLAMAALNTMPLFSLDNGRVIALLLSKIPRLPRAALTTYKYTGLIAVLAMIVGAIASDLWEITKALFF